MQRIVLSLATSYRIKPKRHRQNRVTDKSQEVAENSIIFQEIFGMSKNQNHGKRIQ